MLPQARLQTGTSALGSHSSLLFSPKRQENHPHFIREQIHFLPIPAPASVPRFSSSKYSITKGTFCWSFSPPATGVPPFSKEEMTTVRVDFYIL